MICDTKIFMIRIANMYVHTYTYVRMYVATDQLHCIYNNVIAIVLL